MQHYNFLIIGGDMRNIALAEYLADDGHTVTVAGFSELDYTKYFKITFSENISKAVKNAQIIIGPTPLTSDKISLNTPFSKEMITISSLFSQINKKQFFLAGVIPKELKTQRFKVFDILERNEMAILNAIPTAEGAISVAIENTKITIHNSNVLVIGYGRIATVLCKMLNALGANVFAVTRKFDHYAMIHALGYKPIMLKDLKAYLSSMDIVINTAPHLTIDKDKLKFIKEEALLIELASKPYGIDLEACEKEGIKAILASSLPGKIAPKTAAKYIKETVINIISTERTETDGF